MNQEQFEEKLVMMQSASLHIIQQLSYTLISNPDSLFTVNRTILWMSESLKTNCNTLNGVIQDYHKQSRAIYRQLQPVFHLKAIIITSENVIRWDDLAESVCPVALIIMLDSIFSYIINEAIKMIKEEANKQSYRFKSVIVHDCTRIFEEISQSLRRLVDINLNSIIEHEDTICINSDFKLSTNPFKKDPRIIIIPIVPVFDALKFQNISETEYDQINDPQ